MYKAKGKLRYSVKRESSNQNWWVIVDCDDKIGTYYRHLYKLQHNFCRKLNSPFWGSHISVVRNEEPYNKSAWGAYENQEIEFFYETGVKDNFSPERYRSFYWLSVVCPRFLEIREELGLSPIPKGNFHLTIGSWENPAREAWYRRVSYG